MNQLVSRIAQMHPSVRTEQDAIHYLATLATVRIAAKAQMPNYTTMVQHFLRTLQLPMAIYMLDYYLPMLNPNDGYNETGLTLQSAGPVFDEWQAIQLSYMFKGSEFGHWKASGGKDAFAFRHPSLEQAAVWQLLESEAHHHKVSPIGTGRLVALVGVTQTPTQPQHQLQIIFGLVLHIHPRTSKNKNELPAARILRQCNPKEVELAFLTIPATRFFAGEQFQILQERYSDLGYDTDLVDAHVHNNENPLPKTFFLKDMWMFGITKSTSELAAVARTPLCRYQLGLGIYNVQTAVNGMEGGKRSHLLSLCGQLLRRVLMPYHVKSEPNNWIQETALSFAADLDGHVLGTLCAVTMAFLTNRLDQIYVYKDYLGLENPNPWQFSFWHYWNLTLAKKLKILFLCKENTGTRSFASLLQWLDPPVGVLKRIGRLVGDQERNKASYSYTPFDINPRERRQILSKCQLVMATGGTVSQDLTMQWSVLNDFMHDLSLMVIDEGQQYGTDREIATISLLKQQPLLIWTGDAQQTPGGIARTAPNAKRSQKLLLAKRHGLRGNRTYFMPANLADAMVRLLEDTANEGLVQAREILSRGDNVLGNVWTDQLPSASSNDLDAINAVLPGLAGRFRSATYVEAAQFPRLIDPDLLKGHTVNFSRSLIRLAWILQHADTLQPMASEIQAELNCHTAGVSDSYAWGLMLPSSSRVSPVTYHSVVAVRYTSLCRRINSEWVLSSFASGGDPNRPPGYQFVLWDTNAKLNGLIATDMATLCTHVLESFSINTCDSDGLLVMTTATDHKNSPNRSATFAKTLRVETIANSAGGTAAVAMVMQPSTGFLNGRFLPDALPLKIQRTA